MKKTIKYNQQNIKVDFFKTNHVDIQKEKCQKTLRTIKANGTQDFVINGKVYKTEWETKFKTGYSVRLSFEGFTCGDSEKKMIEHIISKYGV